MTGMFVNTSFDNLFRDGLLLLLLQIASNKSRGIFDSVPSFDTCFHFELKFLDRQLIHLCACAVEFELSNKEMQFALFVTVTLNLLICRLSFPNIHI